MLFVETEEEVEKWRWFKKERVSVRANYDSWGHNEEKAESTIRAFCARDLERIKELIGRDRRNPTVSTGDCRLEGYRTTKLSLYSNGTFVVEMEDRSDLVTAESIQEGTYKKTNAEIIFTVERLIDAEGDVQFSNETIRVQYEDQNGGMYLRDGEGLLRGRGAKEREGLFQ